MAVYYDTEAEGFAVSPDYCGECESPLYDTGCDAPGCLGRSCPECGTGCDIEVAPLTGTCATAIAEEDDDAYLARVDAERSASGLPPLSSEGD